jgi:hypothetical protein
MLQKQVKNTPCIYILVCRLLKHAIFHPHFCFSGSFSIMKFNPFSKIKKGTEKLVLIGTTSAMLLVGLFDCLKQLLYLPYVSFVFYERHPKCPNVHIPLKDH